MKVELIAPAGSFDSLKAAASNGADAVYLGGKRFNARLFAKNFSDDELGKAIRYSHDRNVRVYVTVNTLVADKELCDLDDYLCLLDNLEADAVIIQDIGALKLCKDLYPNLKIHVSTQSTVHNSAGVNFFSNLGAKRVTLARELSLGEISAIKKESNGEIEVFVHGALCFSYSGQCLMSSFFGGRSANRGQCASPCRLPYSFVNKNGNIMRVKGSYLLSMKDLNLSEDIQSLVEAGVDAFKIEGRMKNPEYVAIVTKIYRILIDEKRRPNDSEKQDLEAIFNRGFTKGYIHGNPAFEAISYKRPDNNGVEVGEVTRYDVSSRIVSIILSRSISVGDGLEFETDLGREGLTLMKIFVNGEELDKSQENNEVDIPLPFTPLVNSKVLKTKDIALYNRARSSFMNSEELQSIYPNIYSVVNRKEVKGYERLSNLLVVNRDKKLKHRKICAEVSSINTLEEAILEGVSEVYFGGAPMPGRQLSIKDIEQAITVAKASKTPLTVVLPRIMRDDTYLDTYLHNLTRIGTESVLVGNVGLIEPAKNHGLIPYLDSTNNVFNRITRNVLFDYVSRITLSQEIHISQIARLAGGAKYETEVIVHGPVSVIVSEICPLSNVLSNGDKTSCRKICYENEFFLKDRKGAMLPIKCDENSKAHILYSKDICLLSYIPELKAAGVDVFRIKCHNDQGIVRELIRFYRRALSIDRNRNEDQLELINMKNIIEQKTGAHYSKGRLSGVE